MQSLWQDMRYGLRTLAKKPGFTLVAIITLALGIGANTTIFSLVNATLLRRLPVVEPERLVYGYGGSPSAPYGTVSYPEYLEVRDLNRVLSGLAVWGGIAASLNSDDQAELITGSIVSGNFFEVLGVRAQHGRAISPQDDQTPGGHPVAVISHGLWQRRFGGHAGIIGQTVHLNGHGFTIIGVLPAEFQSAFPGHVNDLYVPMMMQALMRPPRAGYSGEMNPDLLGVRGSRWLWMIGRLRPGVTIEQARASLIPITLQQAELYPDAGRNRTLTLTPVNEGDPEERGSLVTVAGLLMSVVGIVLLIACANVANLLLAHASARRKEIAVRLALGASRRRLVRQLLTESVMLSALGGGVGLLLAAWAVEVLKAAPPPPSSLHINLDFSLDASVFVFTLGLSVLTGIAFGLTPALQASRPDLVAALKGESRGLGAFKRRGRLNLQSALVVVQVTSSLMLLVFAGLFLRSLWRAQAIEPGFDAEKIVTVPLRINLLRYTRAQGREFYRQAVERVEALPGVEAVSLARIVPLSGGSAVRGLLLEGQSGADDAANRGEGAAPDTVGANVIGLEYFRTTGIALARGRDFSALDAEDKPAVVIVSEAFAERHFAGRDALGMRLSVDGARGPWREIVGVARDSKYRTLGEGPTPLVYLPLAQNHETGMTLFVRTAGDPANLAAPVRQAVQSIEKNLPVSGVSPMTELIGGSLYAARMGAALLGAFGLLALLLAAVGLYGVMAYVVSMRTREIGIRMALGARGKDALRLMLRDGMVLVAVGTGFGLLGAVAVSRLLVSFLYGVSATDLLTLAAMTGVLTVVAFIATYIPASRATKVDPLVALRYE